MNGALSSPQELSKNIIKNPIDDAGNDARLHLSPSVLIDDLYKINPHFCPVLMVACDPCVHSRHTLEIMTTISNTWSPTHRMYITQGRDH